MRLLLCCARLRLDPAVRDEIAQILSGPLRWEQVLALAAPHGLEPLMHRHLVETAFVDIPACVRGTLSERFRRTALKNLNRLGELFCVLDLLAANDISAIPYKGPVLSESLYGHVALRPSCDLDIVVNPRHVLRAVELLSQRGYRHAGDDPSDLKYTNHVALSRGDGVVVEVHAALLPPQLSLRLDYAELAQHVISIAVQGRSVCRLTDDGLLVALSAHGTKHYWGRLMWLCDVSILVERLPSAASAIRLAERAGSRRMLLCSFEIVRRLLGSRVPQDAADAIAADPAARALAEWTIANVINGHRPVSYYDAHLFLLKVRDRTSDRLRYLTVLAQRPSVERQWINLPASLHFLYVAIRAFRFFGRVVTAVATRR